MLVSIALPLLLASGSGDPPASDGLFELARNDRQAFVASVTAEAKTDLERARAVVTWFAENFDWTATDYKKRTVDEILERRGGNCNELAMVTTAMLESLGLEMRKVREINLHVLNDRRQGTAEAKVREHGNRMSVFGRRHNDHVWIEIHDRATDSWFPADPSLGVVGEEQWVASRLGFGERYSLDPTSEDMIAPFAIFAYDSENKTYIDRTAHYAIDGFADLYGGRLRRLEAWKAWSDGVASLSPRALGAFQGRVNLHEHGAEIERLVHAYQALREEYAESRP